MKEWPCFDNSVSHEFSRSPYDTSNPNVKWNIQGRLWKERNSMSLMHDHFPQLPKSSIRIKPSWIKQMIHLSRPNMTLIPLFTQSLFHPMEFYNQWLPTRTNYWRNDRSNRKYSPNIKVLRESCPGLARRLDGVVLMPGRPSIHSQTEAVTWKQLSMMWLDSGH